MTLRETILSKYVQFFKEKNQLKNAYGEIKTKIVLKEKEVHRDLTDDEVKEIIKAYANKIKKAIVQTAEDKVKSGVTTVSDREVENTNMLMDEVNDLSQYLDKLIEGSELKKIVEDFVASGVNNIGMLMGKLKDMKVDKKQASSFFNELTK